MKVISKIKKNLTPIIVILLIGLIVIFGLFYFSQGRIIVIDDFDSCKEAGGAILESYPEQCSLRDMTFINHEQATKAPSLSSD